MLSNRALVPLVLALMLTGAVCGCISDGGGDGGEQGVEWGRPIQVRVEAVSVDEDARAINLTVKTYDASDQVTKWDSILRVIATDSKGFDMLNVTFEMRAKDYTTRTVESTIDTWFNMTLPFSVFKRSSDKVMTGFLEGRMMTFHAWITYGAMTYKQSPEGILINMAIIPDDLLVPNQPPTAALTGPVTAWVDGTMAFCAHNSTDDAGFSALAFAWDWGDGNTSTFLADQNESHAYATAGTYTVTVTVTDGEGASDSASLAVTIADLFRILINQHGVVCVEGEHYGQQYVALQIQNVGPTPFDLAGFEPSLVNDKGNEARSCGSDRELPPELDVATTISIVFYFDAPEGYVPQAFRVYDKDHALP